MCFLIGIGFNKYEPINVIEVLKPVVGAFFLSSIPSLTAAAAAAPDQKSSGAPWTHAS